MFRSRRRPPRRPVALLLTGAALAGAAVCAQPLMAAPERAGRVAFTQGGQVWSVRLDGTDARQLTSGAAHDDPAWAPAGDRIAVAAGAVGARDLAIISADGAPLATLPDPTPGTPLDDGQPAWSPDGKELAFVRAVAPPADELWVMGIDGTTKPFLVTRGVDIVRPSWSPDGTQIAFSARPDSLSPHDVFVVTPKAGATPASLMPPKDPGDDLDPSYSPDGSHLALVRDGQVAVMARDGSGLATLTKSIEPKAHPAWYPSADGMVAEVRPLLSGQAAALGGGGLVLIDPTSGAESPLLDNASAPDVQRLPPLPALTSLEPGAAVAGDAGLTLTVHGAAFLPTSVVQWNGAPRATTYVDASTLTAAIPASDLAAAATASVAVATPVPGDPVAALTVALPFVVSATPVVPAGPVLPGVIAPPPPGAAPGAPVEGVAAIPGAATVDEVAPGSALPGGLVSITGAFGGTPTRVLVRGVAAGIVSASSGRVTILVPDLAPGPADVTLIVGDRRLGAPGAFRIGTPPNQPPVANLLALPAASGLTFVFDATLSVDPEGLGAAAQGQGQGQQGLGAGLRSVLWRFGDGGQSTAPVVRHTYPRPGDYHVTLRVTDASGRSSTTTQVVRAVGAGASASARPVNIRIPSQIVFDFGSSALRPESRSYLGRVAKVVRRARGKTRVAGYTDSIGPAGYNLRLSLARARTVRSFLATRGHIARPMLGAVGYGERRPLASNRTELGRQKNRRVVLTFRLRDRAFARV